MRIQGLDHMQLAMPRNGEEQAKRFYGRLLGLTEVPKPEALARRGGCWFVGPGLHLHLGVETDFRPARKSHIALLVDDLESTRAELERADITITADEAGIGVDRFYAHDPFGNRLEFVDQRDRGFTQRFAGRGRQG